MAAGCELVCPDAALAHSRNQRRTSPVSRFNSATAEPFHKLHQALVPALLAITVYGYSVGTYWLRLRSNAFRIWPEAASSSTTLSERMLAMSRPSPTTLPGRIASPAG